MSTPEKIAILGGGVSAITSAFCLTDQENWQEKYDITLYQLGWRIGGKGASGRNAEYGDRIEEHGLHIWFGFYANAFKNIQAVYEEWGRPPGSPLAKWDDAFKPHNFIVLQEFIENEWKNWPIDFPPVPGNPADGNEEIDFWDVVTKAYYWIKDFLKELADEVEAQNKSRSMPIKSREDHDDESWLERVTEKLEDSIEDWIDDFRSDIKSAINRVDEFFESLPKLLSAHRSGDRGAFKYLLKELKAWLKEECEDILDENDNIRRLFISADLGLTILIGMIEDDVFIKGFNVINDYDYRDWLRKHGANEQYTVDSAPVRGFYDLVFAYEKGNFDKPNVEAGTIIRSMMRIALLYKGGVMWKMQAGMGDTIFSPYYEVLKRRGVKFKYFHQVEELIPEGNEINEIIITEQVKLKEGHSEYDPLVNVKDLPCWPSQPRFEQIDDEQVALIKANNINLESFWSNWPQVYEAHYNKPLPKLTLKKGQDFDKVIFGISIGSVPHLCPKLLEQDAAFKKMVDEVQTVVTQAYQVWTNVDLAGLGWTDTPEGQEPVASGFVEPYDTWAAMNQLLVREKEWAPGVEAKNVAYFCSAQPVDNFPPRPDPQFVTQHYEQAKLNGINHLKNDMYWLWPEVATKGTFDWSILLDTKGYSGEQRFNEQYWRSNVDPSERYVLSVANSSQYRLDTNDTLFTNLFITGDWIKTGLNAGCVEAATMAGMQTSRAISGHPAKIMGEDDI